MFEQTVEESKKRKIGNEEAESSEQKASDCVSDIAYIAWKEKLQYKNFLKERCNTSSREGVRYV